MCLDQFVTNHPSFSVFVVLMVALVLCAGFESLGRK